MDYPEIYVSGNSLNRIIISPANQDMFTALNYRIIQKQKDQRV